MITLQKSGNAIKFVFDDNSGYLQNGTIEVPVNSLTLVMDSSDMVTFRKSASNDIFVSALYSEFGMSKGELETWYKTNMVGSTGGSGSGGTTPEEVQAMIDESISGLAESSAVTLEIAEATSGKADSDSLATVATSGSYDDLTNKPTIPTVPTSNTAFTNDAGYITSSALNGYATEQWVGEQGYLTEHQSLSAYSTTEQMNSAISSATDDMATQTWVGEQGYITGVDLSNYATLQDIPDVSNYFDGAEYDSGTTRINFYHGNTVKAYIDASAFVIDGMIDDVRIETIGGTSYLVIDFNTASGKEDIQIPLTDIFDPSNYYNKTEVDNAISAATSGKADTSAVTEAISTATNDMATQTWVNNQGFLTEHQSLSAYSTTEEVNSAIQEATSGKADTSAVTAVNDVLTAHTADTTIHVTSADKTAWNAKSDFSGSYNDLTDKPTIPTVPTSNTAFTNDAGYITEDALSGYAESSAVTEEITAAVSGKASQTDLETVSGAVSNKQDTLVSGTNIKTINNQSLLGSGNIDIQGGGGTIDQSLDSGSTNPVANSAITSALTADEYHPYECEIMPYHSGSENYWHIEGENNLRYSYLRGDTNYGDKILFFFSDNIYWDGSIPTYYEAWLAKFEWDSTEQRNVLNSITFVGNNSGTSLLTATIVNEKIFFVTKNSNTFHNNNYNTLQIGYSYEDEPSSYTGISWNSYNHLVVDDDIIIDFKKDDDYVAAEPLKNRVKRLYDIVDGIKDYKAEIKDIQLENGNFVGEMESWNPLIGKHCATEKKTIFKYNAIDFSGGDDNSTLTFTKSYLDKDNVLLETPYISIDDFTDGTSYSGGYETSIQAIALSTNASYEQSFGDLRFTISSSLGESGEISLMYMDGSIDLTIMFGGVMKMLRYEDVTLGDVILIDLRYVLPSREWAFTVGNFEEETFLTSFNVYSSLGDGCIVTFDEWQEDVRNKFAELDDKEEVVTRALYELKNTKQDTLSAGTGISIVDNVISATGGGGGTIDPSLDSGSTNAVANSAITEAIANATDGRLKEDLVFSGHCGYGTIHANVGSANDEYLIINTYPSTKISFLAFRSRGLNYRYEIVIQDIATKDTYRAYYVYTYNTITSSGGTGINYATVRYASSTQTFTANDGYRIIGLVRDMAGSGREHYSHKCTYNANIPSGTTLSELFGYITNVNANLKGLTNMQGATLNSQYYTDEYGGELYYQQTVFPTNDSFTGHTASTVMHTTQAEKDSWNGKLETSAITTAITSSSTDSQVPSAKAVNDKLGGLTVVKLTESEYTALVTKDSNTLYVVVPDPSN